MRLKLYRLEIKNFLSYGERQVIDLHKKGVVGVEGVNHDKPESDSNRSGKSAIIEAIVWCLFDKTIRGISHDRVVNRFVKKDCEVSLFFRVEQTRYKVSRYRNHEKWSSGLRLFRNGECLKFRKRINTQSKLEGIIGCTFSSFVNAVIFGGASSFASLSDSGQKAVLESLLGFELFDIAAKRCKELISEFKEIEQEQEKLLVEVQSRVTLSKEKLSMLKEHKDVRISELKNSLRKDLEKLAETRDTDTSSAEEAVSQAEAVVENKSSELAVLESKIERLESQLQDLNGKITNKDIVVGLDCPACGKKVLEDDVEHYERHLTLEVKGVSRELKKLYKEQRIISREVKHGRKYLKRLHTKQNSKFVHLGFLKEIEERAMATAKELGSLALSSSLFEEQILEEQINYSASVSELLAVGRNLRRIASNINDLKFWEIGFSNKGIKALILKDALPALNSKLKEYSSRIFGSGVDIRFESSKALKSGTEKELFHIHYEDKSGGESYQAESAGGRKRVDICILLVFSWLSRICDCLFCDELLDGLDQTGREAVLDILSEQKGTVLVISHHWNTNSKVRRVWKVVKQNGISKIETN